MTKTAFIGIVAPAILITSILSMTSFSDPTNGTVTSHGDFSVPLPVTPIDEPSNFTFVCANALANVTTRLLVVPGT